MEQEFEKEEPSTDFCAVSTKRKGIGIGLAMVQKLVLQHKGTISVESSPEGSVFRVQLPR